MFSRRTRWLGSAGSIVESMDLRDASRKWQSAPAHSQMARPRTCVETRVFHDRAAINKDGHARIIIMRPETILH